MKNLKFPCLSITQPIGTFYIGVLSHKDLLEISYVDQRRLESEVDKYMGIQRHLSKARVLKIGSYVNNIDATFPTSVILSIDESNCSWRKKSMQLEIFETEDKKFGDIAKVLDGQHRIDGLKSLEKNVTFELSVTIFVEVDLATQANIFSTVNLAQTVTIQRSQAA